MEVCEDTAQDRLTIQIVDNGRGMSADQVAHVTDPFFTTRTTRKVGLGIPLFKMEAEMTVSYTHLSGVWDAILRGKSF